MTSLTTTFDRKWRSLVNSSNQTIRGTTMENLSLSDEDAVITQRDSQNLRNQRGGGGGGGLREEKDQEKTTIPQSSFSIESYRDPSLHKMCIEKHQYDRQKNASIRQNRSELLKLVKYSVILFFSHRFSLIAYSSILSFAGCSGKGYGFVGNGE